MLKKNEGTTETRVLTSLVKFDPDHFNKMGTECLDAAKSPNYHPHIDTGDIQFCINGSNVLITFESILDGTPRRVGAVTSLNIMRRLVDTLKARMPDIFK
jgi:hypothetical protein